MVETHSPHFGFCFDNFLGFFSPLCSAHSRRARRDYTGIESTLFAVAAATVALACCAFLYINFYIVVTQQCSLFSYFIKAAFQNNRSPVDCSLIFLLLFLLYFFLLPQSLVFCCCRFAVWTEPKCAQNVKYHNILITNRIYMRPGFPSSRSHVD